MQMEMECLLSLLDYLYYQLHAVPLEVHICSSHNIQPKLVCYSMDYRFIYYRTAQTVYPGQTPSPCGCDAQWSTLPRPPSYHS